MKKLIGFYSPYCLLPHRFKFKKKPFVFNSFFLSFGDALLSLINHFGLTTKSIALLPNFYCPETAEAIGKKLKVVFYKINSDFSLNIESYFEQIIKYSPDLIINYSFTGFSLNQEEKEKLKSIVKENTIIIDDFAHQFLESNFNKIHPRHLALDSIRKHSPFLGSHLVGIDLKNEKVTGQFVNFYKIKSIILQWQRNFFDLLCVLTQAEFFNNLSDKVFLLQDEIIGNNPKPTKGCPISYFLYQTVDWAKIWEHKKKLQILFSQELNALNLNDIKALPINIAEKATINYLPIFVEKSKKEALLDYLNEKNIFVDILWETKPEDPAELRTQALYESFIIYPLTWLIKEKDIANLVKNLKDFSSNNEK